MVPTCKNVAPYSPTPLNVGRMVNAPLCNSLYLFLSFLCHPYILTIFVKFSITSMKARLRRGGLPCSGVSTTARQRLSADASMLCDSVLMSAGQYADICNVMCAWHVSMQGKALSGLCYYIAWSASKWSTCQCTMLCLQVGECNIMFNILAKGSMCMVVIHVCAEDEAVQ